MLEVPWPRGGEGLSEGSGRVGLVEGKEGLRSLPRAGGGAVKLSVGREKAVTSL